MHLLTLKMSKFANDPRHDPRHRPGRPVSADTFQQRHQSCICCVSRPPAHPPTHLPTHLTIHSLLQHRPSDPPPPKSASSILTHPSTQWSVRTEDLLFAVHYGPGSRCTPAMAGTQSASLRDAESDGGRRAAGGSPAEGVLGAQGEAASSREGSGRSLRHASVTPTVPDPSRVEASWALCLCPSETGPSATPTNARCPAPRAPRGVVTPPFCPYLCPQP